MELTLEQRVERLEERILILEKMILPIDMNEVSDATISKIILSVVSSVTCVPIAFIEGRQRLRKYVDARMVYCALCKIHTRLSLSAIAQNIGNRDHATIINALEKHADMMETDKSYRRTFQICEKEFKAKFAVKM